jgi:hypothetical protein
VKIGKEKITILSHSKHTLSHNAHTHREKEREREKERKKEGMKDWEKMKN